ncbi:MAG: alpha/beta hydrolase [Gammaproteobacteria bacterium MedPE]|nr:MAG: alpha/beta hydrolase [Gammaproteobacteria bacterium MedPE]
MITQHSHHIDFDDHRIHLREISPAQPTDLPPVLMLHGAIEDGRIFYSKSGKGLASTLARAGHTVYVIDSRGRGQSTPPIGSDNNHGQFEMITHTLPECHRWVLERHTNHSKIHWMAHSWGGVIMSSALARFPELSGTVASQVFFGTKRTIKQWSVERVFKVEFLWKRFGPWLAKRKGHFPFKEWKMGSDNETYLSLNEGQQWVRSSPWVDPRDNFDYGNAASKIKWPRTWFISAINDHLLGHPKDVQRFSEEVGSGELSTLSKANGNHHDYDHINMLTHPKAVDDYFPQVIKFIQK